MPKGMRGFQKGHKPFYMNFNPPSEETKKKISLANKGKHYSPDTEFKKGGSKIDNAYTFPIGKNHPNWKGGTATKDYNKWQRDRRRFRRKTDENYRLMCKADDHKKRSKRKMKLGIIQKVYEDNIKKYGTLTCYLCLNPIPFGKDHLEHKIPISRGGTNDRVNLDVACMKCNCSKRDKTDKEFLSKMEE